MPDDVTMKRKKSVWRKRLLALQQRLVLTREEKKVIAFVLIAFLLGAATKHYRDAHPQPQQKIDKKHAASFSDVRRAKN